MTIIKHLKSGVTYGFYTALVAVLQRGQTHRVKGDKKLNECILWLQYTLYTFLTAYILFSKKNLIHISEGCASIVKIQNMQNSRTEQICL